MLEITKYLSVYAAVLSTVVFLWNVRQARSTFRVRLGFSLGYYAGETVPGWAVDIQNPSSHTISLTGLSFLMCYKSESWFMSRIRFFRSRDPLAQPSGIEITFPPDLVACNLPAIVQPRAAHKIFVPCAVIERFKAASNEAVFQVVVRDALGRRRYSPKFIIPAAINDYDVQAAAA